MTNEAHNHQEAEARATETQTNGTRSQQADDADTSAENASIDESDGGLGQRPPDKTQPGEQSQSPANTEDEPSSHESALALGSSKPADPNQKALSDLPGSDLDLSALLHEPIPTEKDDVAQRELFIKRQYEGERFSGLMNALFQRRIGLVLIGLQQQTKHGEWEDYVSRIFPFCPRTASTYMRIARQVSEAEATQHTTYDIMVKLDMAGQSAEHSAQDALDLAAKKLKGIWKEVISLSKYNGSLMTALRRAEGHNPAFHTLASIIREIRTSIDSLLDDVDARRTISEDWDERHEEDAA